MHLNRPRLDCRGPRSAPPLATRTPRDREVMTYYGCCPLTKCPNIHPAYDALRKMGFRRLRVLNLPYDFAHDWAEKGLPVHKGAAP